MRQITLNNTLKEKNVWFRVTPEQGIKHKLISCIGLNRKQRKFAEINYEENS